MKKTRSKKRNNSSSNAVNAYYGENVALARFYRAKALSEALAREQDALFKTHREKIGASWAVKRNGRNVSPYNVVVPTLIKSPLNKKTSGVTRYAAPVTGNGFQSRSGEAVGGQGGNKDQRSAATGSTVVLGDQPSSLARTSAGVPGCKRRPTDQKKPKAGSGRGSRFVLWCG
jgi:hypothetical protein